jgi:hypothetical protein
VLAVRGTKVFRDAVADLHLWGGAAVRARRGRLRALRVFLYKSSYYGAFVWALNSPKRRFPARAGRRPAAPRRRRRVGGAARLAPDVTVILTPPCIFH